jgi:hypothetical protein
LGPGACAGHLDHAFCGFFCGLLSEVFSFLVTHQFNFVAGAGWVQLLVNFPGSLVPSLAQLVSVPLLQEQSKLVLKKITTKKNSKRLWLQVDQRLGINEQNFVGTVFMPGFLELTSCFLRLVLTTDVPLKPTYRVGHGPPSVVCNWSDRAAACALALAQHGTVMTVGFCFVYRMCLADSCCGIVFVTRPDGANEHHPCRRRHVVVGFVQSAV